MITVAGVITLAGLLFWLWAIIDAWTTDKAHVRLLPRFVWIVLLFLLVELAPLAALVWVLLGRPRAGALPRRRGEGGQRTSEPGGFSVPGNLSRLGEFGRGPGRGTPDEGASRPTRPNRPIGPDDDPEFLRKL